MRLLALREDMGRQVREALPRARIAVEITDDRIAYPLLHRHRRSSPLWPHQPGEPQCNQCAR